MIYGSCTSAYAAVYSWACEPYAVLQMSPGLNGSNELPDLRNINKEGVAATTETQYRANRS